MGYSSPQSHPQRCPGRTATAIGLCDQLWSWRFQFRQGRCPRCHASKGSHPLPNWVSPVSHAVQPFSLISPYRCWCNLDQGLLDSPPSAFSSAPEQGFSTLQLLTFQVRSLCFRICLCIVGCLATSLASTHNMPIACPPLNCDNPNCLQARPSVSCRTKLSPHP